MDDPISRKETKRRALPETDVPAVFAYLWDVDDHQQVVTSTENQARTSFGITLLPGPRACAKILRVLPSTPVGSVGRLRLD